MFPKEHHLFQHMYSERNVFMNALSLPVPRQDLLSEPSLSVVYSLLGTSTPTTGPCSHSSIHLMTLLTNGSGGKRTFERSIYVIHVGHREVKDS